MRTAAALLISLAALDAAAQAAMSSQYLMRSGGKMTGSIRFDVHAIAADDATPSVAGANIFVTSANTAPTAITDLDNPLAGQLVIICGGSNTDSSTIADAGNFALNSAFTASLDECIELYVQADNDYVEIGRTDAGGWSGTATSDLDMSGNDIDNALTVTSAAANPADSGQFRLGEAEQICWEAATERCIWADATPNFNITAPIIVDAISAADTGAVRLDNADPICWEAEPAGSDQCLSVNSSEQLTHAGTQVWGGSAGSMTCIYDTSQCFERVTTGDVEFNNNGSDTIVRPLSHGTKIVSSTGGSLTGASTFPGIITNSGATSLVTVDASATPTNRCHHLIVQDTDGVKFDAAASDTITWGTTTSAASGYVCSTEVGASLTICGVSATEWFVIGAPTGTWTIDTGC